MEIEHIQKNLILFFIGLLFVCIMFYFILYWYQHWNRAVFEENLPDVVESFENISDLVQIEKTLALNHHMLDQFNKHNWWNHKMKNANIPIIIRWKDLSWSETEQSRIGDKNTDFTVSFWIYLLNHSDLEQVIFRIVDPGPPGSNRIPGIYLKAKENALSIRCKTSSHWNDGKSLMDESNDCKLMSHQPIFVSITFSRTQYNLYLNGRYITEYTWNDTPVSIIDLENAYIETGTIAGSNTFVLHHLTIHPMNLTSTQVAAMYDKRKTQLKKVFLSMDQAKQKAKRSLGLLFEDDEETSTTVLETFTSPLVTSSTSTSTQTNSNTRSNNIDLRGMVPFYSLPITSDLDDTTIVSKIGGRVTPTRMVLPAHENREVYSFFIDKYEKQSIPIQSPQLSFGPDGFSMACWFKGESTHNEPRAGLFLATKGNNHILYWMFEQGGLYAFVLENSETNGRKMTTEKVMDNALNNQWVHVVWVLHPNRGWKFYINGQLIKDLYNVDNPSQYAYPVDIGPRTQQIGEHFHGYIADFRLIPAAISNHDVKILYNQPKVLEDLDPSM